MKMEYWYLGRKAPIIFKYLKVTIKRVPVTGSILIGCALVFSVMDLGSVATARSSDNKIPCRVSSDPHERCSERDSAKSQDDIWGLTPTQSQNKKKACL